MNKSFSLLLIAVALLVSCKHSQERPPEVKPEPTPFVTPSPTPEPTPEPVVCSKSPTVTCGGFVLQGCDKFADANDLIAKAQAEKMSNGIALDGVSIYFGFGPFLQCEHIK